MKNTTAGNVKSNPNLATYRGSYIVSGVLFALLFALYMTVFGIVAFNAGKEYSVTMAGAGMTFQITYVFAIAAAVLCAMLTAVRCAKANKLKNPDTFTPPHDTVYYFKRMGFITLMIVLMGFAASLIGMFVNSLLAGVFLNIENKFLSGLLMKLPLFIVYIALVYKMLVRYGFMDSQRKIFNPDLKLLACIIAFIIMLPNAVYDSYFFTPKLEIEGSGMLMVNVQTVLSPNEGVYTAKPEGFEPNENFGAASAALIALTVLLSFAIQAFIFRFAYNRGKKIFIKQHLREIDYDMDENI